jgi:hypothetical protein
MSAAVAGDFVARFERLAGSRVRKRLDAYRAAYCAQRMGETLLAAKTQEHDECASSLAAYAYYQRGLSEALRATGVATPLLPEQREAWSH